MLRDEGQVAERLAPSSSATSRYATDLLEREPQGVRMLGESLAPLSAEALTTEMLAIAGRHDEPEAAARAVRAVRRRELFRIACGDLFEEIDVAEVGEGLSRLTDATLEATLRVAMEAVRRQRALDAAPTRMAVVAMGRYGGFELSYGSDADVMFVHEPVPGVEAQVAASYAQAVVDELRRLLSLPGHRPAARGRRRTCARRASRGRWCAPSSRTPPTTPSGRRCGSPRPCCAPTRWSATRTCARRFTALIDPLRFPEDGISEDDIVEVRRIKARVDDERLPRGADPHTHLKLGRGGLADVEWTVQLLQMRHAGRVEGLRTPQTLEALEAAVAAGIVDREDADTLAASWRLVSRVRNAVTLVRGKPAEQLPRDARERAAVAAVLGYAPGTSDLMLNDYLRTTRRAHAVVEKVFWE